MLTIVFSLKEDNEMIFYMIRDFFKKTDVKDLDVKIDICYSDCGDSFKHSLELVEKEYHQIKLHEITPEKSYENSSKFCLHFKCEESDGFLVKDLVERRWLHVLMEMFTADSGLTKIRLCKKFKELFVERVASEEEIEDQYEIDEDIFLYTTEENQICERMGIGMYENEFGGILSANCHIPILVIHQKIPKNFNNFKHSYLRFLHFIVTENTTKEDYSRIIASYSPKCLLTIGVTIKTGKILSSFHFEIRKKWINTQSVDVFKTESIEFCTFASFDHMYQYDNPLITVITPTYESKHRIQRPYRSLMSQTYTNWEWVIIDDSKTIHTWKTLKKFAENDCRIKIFRREENDGYIGKNKFFCSVQSKGELIFELDHDDDVLPDAMQILVDAYKKYPEAGFFYSDFIECEEPTNSDESTVPPYGTYCHPFSYGTYFGLGFGAYYRQWICNAFQYVAKTSRMNTYTFRHIVGVPNHFRCWTRKAYIDVGCHNEHLTVADDYDLILRTMFKYKWVHIPEMLYVQYRNAQGSNFTFYRNSLIQYLVAQIRFHHEGKIQKLLGDNQVNDENKNCSSQHKKLDFEINYFDHKILEIVYNRFDQDESKPCISIVIPTYNRSKDLRKALDSIFNQSYQNFEVLLVGDNCPTLNDFVYKYQYSKDRRFKWFNLEKNYGAGGAVPRNYAIKVMCITKWIAYLDDDNEWTSDHLESLVELKNNNVNASYFFSSMIVNDNKVIFNEQPRKGRIDTSCVMHKFDLCVKYGLWKDRVEAGYAHDWEFFSRWKDEPWVASEKCTLIYNTEYNCQTFESISNM